MGSLFVSNIEKFQEELSLVINNNKIPEITLTSLGYGKYTHFNLEVSEGLQKLHTAVFDLVTKYSAGEVVKENFFEMHEASSLIDWVHMKNTIHT